MTTAQRLTRKAHAAALRDYRNAVPGERERTRKALRDAATAILVADIAARRAREQRKAA